MSNVLYRKYRSKSFSEIVGQETIVSILRESIVKESISHAYLFCGPRGTGKTSIARIFSRAVNCEKFHENNDVCNVCENCMSILNEQAMDIIEMDAASNRGIEEIRNLKDSVNYLPTSLKKKVYIIDESHMLTKEAFNALLKTLEEPPEHVIFILATTEAHKLPITILSRVERYDFRLATKEEMVQKLEKILENENKSASDDIWDVIYTKSGGSFRDAESLLGKIIANTKKKKLTKEYVFNVLGIYSEDDIDLLVQSIQERDFPLFQKSLNSLNNLNGNINTLVDQVLEKLHSIIVNSVLEGKNTGNYSEMINMFIKIKKDLRDFSDKRMILELNIINYMNKDQISHLQSNVAEISPKKEESQVLDSEAVQIEPELKNKISTESESSTDNILVQIAMSPEVRLPRLKAILMNSNYELENNTLKIYNKYKFNIAFLQKQENKSVILSALGVLNVSVSELVVEQDLNKNEATHEERILEKEVIEEKKKTEPVEVIDNSDIIEDILQQ